MDDSKQKEDPKCPCGSIPLGAMFRRDNGACSACGKQVPAPTVSGLPEIVEHPGYYDHGRFGHYYPGAMYQEMLATARKLHALVTSQQQEIETLNNQVGSLRWQIERIEEECTAAGWSLQWTDGGGSKCPFGWTRNPYLNIGTREDYMARIASLEAQLSSVSAQAPQVCAGFEAHCDGSYFCVCGLPESAPCHQHPASDSERVVLETPGWSEQPAAAGVPPMPEPLPANRWPSSQLVCREETVRALHAAAVRLAERCKRAEANEGGRLRVICQKVVETIGAEGPMGTEDAVWKLAEKYDEARAQLREAAGDLIVVQQQLAEAQAALAQAKREERERVAAALEKLDKEQAAGFVRGLRDE